MLSGKFSASSWWFAVASNEECCLTSCSLGVSDGVFIADGICWCQALELSIIFLALLVKPLARADREDPCWNISDSVQ